jgi:hypothetical protein
LAEGGGHDPHSNWNRTISSRLREPSRVTLPREMMMSLDCWTWSFSYVRGGVYATPAQLSSMDFLTR